jgi:hypothetical protein
VDAPGAVFPVAAMNRPEGISTLPVADGAFAVSLPRSIDLAIRGADLVLAGRFQHWVPLTLETGGGQSEAQLLFDVTSPGPANDTGDVFSFASADVRSIGDGAFMAKGVLRRGELERPVDAVVQAPAAHSPFAAVTFQIDETAFPEVWSELSEQASARITDGEVRPWAWMLAPVLAAA